MSGKALASWYKGIEKKIASDAIFTKIRLDTLAVNGQVISNNGNNNLGTALTVSSTGILAANSLSNTLQKLSTAAVFPSTHILNGNRLIAPGLSFDRWILLNTNNDDEVPHITGFSLSN